MRRFALIAVLVAVACASDRTAAIADPDFALLQISRMPEVATHVAGSFPVKYRLHVGNHAPIPITLKVVSLQSVGMGAYDVPATSRPFNAQIAPEQSAEVEFFVPAVVQDPTILGANGPVTLHGIVTFDSPWGAFQRSFMLQANEMANGQ